MTTLIEINNGSRCGVAIGKELIAISAIGTIFTNPYVLRAGDLEHRLADQRAGLFYAAGVLEVRLEDGEFDLIVRAVAIMDLLAPGDGKTAASDGIRRVLKDRLA